MKQLLPFLLLLLVPAARATVLPNGVSLHGGKMCNSMINAVAVGAGTVQCDMSNVVAGDTVIAAVNMATATTYSVSATETLTCPANLLTSANFSGFVHQVFICYVVLASNHADFNVTITALSGAGARPGFLQVYEFAGLGAIDTGSETAGHVLSTSFTTANANEMAFVFGSDLSNGVQASGSNRHWDDFSGVAGAGTYYQIDMIQNTAAAGSYTASFTSTSSSSVQFIVVAAFQIAGGFPQTGVFADQMVHRLGAFSAGTQTPSVFDVSAGQKLVVTAHTQTLNNPAFSCSISTGETCTCPGNTFALVTVIDNFAQGICTGDFLYHAGAVTISLIPSPSTAAFDIYTVYVFNGLGSGFDSGSAANANATTLNSTTAANNEYTICFASDESASYPLGLMTPGNGFAAINNGYAEAQNLRYPEGLDMGKPIATAGTNTCSYTIGASLAPLMSALSFTASTTTASYVKQTCAAGEHNSNTNTVFDCFLTNTTSGNVITVGITGASQSASPGGTIITFTTATESFTCPANSTNEHIYPTNNDEVTKLCYVITASSHGSFEVKITVTGSSPQIHSLVVEEWIGLTTFDSGSASNAAAMTVSATTANANEIVLAYCSDYAGNLQPGNGYSQISKAQGVSETSGTEWRGFKGYQLFATSGAKTANCASAGGSVPQIVAFAFQQTPAVVPSPRVVQWCMVGLGPFGNTGQGDCALTNVVAGNKVITMALMRGLTVFSPTVANNCTETCTYLSGTFTTAVYSANTYSSVIGYVDLVNNHANFTAGVVFSGCPGCTAAELISIEVSGLLPGVDTGSEAAAAAVTVNYTTASANEWTISIGGDAPLTVMTPGNSFLQTAYTQKPGGGEVIFGGLAMAKTTGSSGSSTVSFSVSGSSAPMIATVSFPAAAVSASSVPRKRGQWIGD